MSTSCDIAIHGLPVAAKENYEPTPLREEVPIQTAAVGCAHKQRLALSYQEWPSLQQSCLSNHRLLRLAGQEDVWQMQHLA